MLLKCKKEQFEVDHCESVLKKFRGLMFRRKPKNDGLLFSFRREGVVGIHMFFVFFPIDIVYVNSKKKIVEIKKKVKPFTPYIRGPAAQYIIELKDSKGLTVGQTLDF